MAGYGAPADDAARRTPATVAAVGTETARSDSETISLVMPDLGRGTDAVTVTCWLRNVGETVTVGDPLLEISTDKVDVELPAPAAGTLLEIHAVKDDVVPVGAVLAVIRCERSAE